MSISGGERARDAVRAQRLAAAQRQRDAYARMIADAVLHGDEVGTTTTQEYGARVDALKRAWLAWQQAHDEWTRITRRPPQ